jgi:hypothetical protein
MKIFGLGDTTSSQTLSTYLHPADIAFEGALSGSMSDVTSLSYGADGLPRVVRGAEPSTYVGTEVSRVTSPDGLFRNVSGSTWSTDTVHELQVLVETGLHAVSDAAAARPQSATDSLGDGLAAGRDSQWPGGLSDIGTLTHSSFSPGASTTSLNPLFDSSGMDYARTIDSSPPVNSTGTGVPSSGAWPSFGKDNTEASHPATGQNILVQVHAMDSQSFMDHSQEIAQAVRQAMLNMHSVNDVMSDL